MKKTCFILCLLIDLIAVGQRNPVIRQEMRYPGRNLVSDSVARLAHFEEEWGKFYRLNFTYEDVISAVDSIENLILEKEPDYYIRFEKYISRGYLKIEYFWARRGLVKGNRKFERRPLKLLNPSFLIWGNSDTVNIQRIDKIGVYPVKTLQFQHFEFLFAYIDSNWATMTKERFIDEVHDTTYLPMEVYTGPPGCETCETELWYDMVVDSYPLVFEHELPVGIFLHDLYDLDIVLKDSSEEVSRYFDLAKYYPGATEETEKGKFEKLGNDSTNYILNWSQKSFQFALMINTYLQMLVDDHFFTVPED